MGQSRLERRRHRVYLTRNTEYHCRDRECVGVRDRRTGEWSRWHKALRGELVGGLDPTAREVQRQPSIGFRLLFDAGQAVITSRLVNVRRPPRDDTRMYCNLVRSGAIES
jgi:hypothetical protein